MRAAVVGVALILLGGCDRPKYGEFRPWTDVERQDGVAYCESQMQGGGACFARTFCQCAQNNYEARETTPREFRESIIPAYSPTDTKGYFCADRARSACPK